MCKTQRSPIYHERDSEDYATLGKYLRCGLHNLKTPYGSFKQDACGVLMPDNAFRVRACCMNFSWEHSASLLDLAY